MPSKQDRAETQKWLEAWYAVADKCIPSNSIKWFAEDCIVQFNNSPPVHGSAAAEAEFSSIAPIIAWMGHTIISFDVVGDRIYNECEVSYIAKSDPEQKKITMHRMNVYERVPKGHLHEGKITKWTAYFDSSPLKERIALTGSGERVY